MIVKRNAFSLQMREMLDSLLKKTVRKKTEDSVSIWKYKTVYLCLQRSSTESTKLKFNRFDHGFFPKSGIKVCANHSDFTVMMILIFKDTFLTKILNGRV